jgi:hypothetical protein
MIRRSWTRAASIEETLALWAASLREIKKRIRPLFRQERVATNAGLFLEGLLGDEQRKTGIPTCRRRSRSSGGRSMLHRCPAPLLGGKHRAPRYGTRSDIGPIPPARSSIRSATEDLKKGPQTKRSGPRAEDGGLTGEGGVSFRPSLTIDVASGGPK